MIAFIIPVLVLSGLCMPGLGHLDELDIFYSDCTKYETDLFGGPVCGTDGITYRNGVHLRCLNHHHKKRGGQEIDISSHGSCPGDKDISGCPWNPLYKPVCGTDGKTYCNLEWLICTNNKTGEDVEVYKPGECNYRDPCIVESHSGPSVCASNGFTYPNADAVRCLRKHRSDLDIVHEGGCTVEEVKRHYPSRMKICEISRMRHEYNPICGSNTTYGNPFIFLCTRPLAAAPFSGGVCDCSIQKSCRMALKLDEEYEECRRDTYFPEVCGSDGLTYRSEDHLICASKNNSQLTILHRGACTIEDSPCLRSKELKGTQPVCGSDGITYSSFVALSCVARYRDPNLHFVHLGVCNNRRPHCLGDDCY